MTTIHLFGYRFSGQHAEGVFNLLEQVALIGEVIGRGLRYDELTPDEARRELGFPAPVMEMLLDSWAAALGRTAFVTSTVEAITGRPARTFRDWVSDNAAAFDRESKHA